MSRFLSLIILSLFSFSALAGDRPVPASWSLDRDATADLAAIPLERFGALDLEALALDDADREAMGEPPRFAWPHATAFSAELHGSWDQLADTEIWRIRVHAENANLINFGFANVHLPPGSRLYIYSPKAALAREMDRYRVIGPYDHSINHDHGEFWAPNLQGDEAIVEINVPAASRAQLSFEIAQVSHGYRGFGEAALGYRQSSDRADGDGKQACRDEGGVRSGACNQDVACLSEDDPWNDPRQAVGAYQRSGSFACTGSLVNNTAQDQRMLFMTATHCIVQAQAPSIVVYWNYEWPTCRRPGAAGGTSTNPPDPNMSHSGGTWLAATVNPFGGGGCTNGSQCSDVTLIELNQPADPDFNLFWAGWDRRPPPTVCAQGPDNSTAGLCATIHHPGVHEKRITWVEQNIQVGNIAAANGVHWHPFWHPNPPELPNMPPPPPSTIPPAVTEGGSSGSPLYSADRRLLGVLSGGPAFCGATGNSLSDFYGGLFHAWDGLGTPTTRMRDHLDPLGTAPLFIDGTGRDGFTLHPDPAEISQCGFDDIVIDIEVGQLGDFDDPVTLATDGLPGGVSSFFPVNPVIPPDSTTLTLGNLTAAGFGPFSFSLEGEAGKFDQSVNISVLLTEDSPPPTTISSPANGATGVGTSPTIEWSALADATGYDLEIATDSGFTAIVYSTSTDSSSHQLTSSLGPNTTYYVRVRGSNDCGDGDWSTTISFTTANEICLAPGTAIPDNNPAGINSDMEITETGTITGLEMTLDITHTWVGDLIISLTHIESGTSIELVNRAIGSNATFGCSSENIQTGVSDDAPVSLQNDCVDGGVAVAYPEPAYSPIDPLADFIGVDAAGTWRLTVSDNAGGDLGTLNEWCLLPGIASTATYSIGGTVSGLEGSGLVLQNNGGDDLTILANGSFEFDTELFDGQDYDVSVAVQPTAPAQTCDVINGSGTVSDSDITDIEVVCQTDAFTIGGTVSGLEGSGLVLHNNGGDDLAVSADGSFEFSTPVIDGGNYSVSVAVQPENPLQTCTVSNGAGQVDGADVTDIEVSCETETFSIGGTVSGLQGSGLVLASHGESLPIADNGSFVFVTELAQGESYAVTIENQPDDPLEFCVIENGAGTIGTENVDDVIVDCELRSIEVFHDRFESLD